MFVHDRVRTRIFGDALSLKSPVFQAFLACKTLQLTCIEHLPPEYFSSDGYVRWCPTQTSLPNQRWVNRVWTFLDGETKNVLKETKLLEQEIRSIRVILQPLSNWSILPCTETIRVPSSWDKSTFVVVPEHFLVPLRLAESVLDFTDHDANSRSLVKALKMLSLPEVNHAILSLDPCYLARKLVASLKTPTSLLRSLEQKMTTNPQALEGKFKTSESCLTILQYFSGNVKSLEECDKNTLRRLPFYQAANVGFISLNNESVCVLPNDIPRKEMDEFGRRLNVVFLETLPSLSPLFKFLSFQCVSAIDQRRTAGPPRVHPGFYFAMKSSGKQSLLDCLRNTAIVTSEDGTLKKASSYYDPRNDTFAMDVACEGATQRTERTDEKSKLLVRHLFSRENVVEEGLLQAVCDVRFVAADPVKQELREIHRPFAEEMDGMTPYIAFKGSVLLEHTKMVWTTAALLPDWANARKYQYQVRAPADWERSETDYCNAILSRLQVLTVPTVDLVTSHCQNVSWQLATGNDSHVALRQQCKRVSVMKHIYRFLQANAVSSTVAKERLEHTPCVLVENGQRFVFAKQVVIELYASLEIKPFLYRMPAELSEFATLFRYLGCSPSVTPSHYAMVLDMLHGQCKTNRLHPNEVDSALGAVKGLFETLQDTSEAKQDLSTLYLPATCPFSSSRFDDTVMPIVLTNATELIFDDAPHYHDRIQDFDLPFVVALKRANVNCKANANYKELIMLLPPPVRPQMMSSVIEEKFADSEDNTERFDVGAASSLKKQLHSEQFYRGIVRLIRHANQDGGLDESVVTTVRSSLQSIEFLGMNKIITHLVHNGIVISGSEHEVPFFLKKVSESGQEIWKVYINAVEDVEETMSTIALTLSQVIAEACRGLLRDTAMYIPEMLRSQPGKICSLLDKMKIRQDDSYDAEKGDVYPAPGSFIPIVEHHLLNPAFEAFTPGEYVGYELDDPSLELLEGDATFIYAVIIEEVTSDNASLFTRSYKINIGDDKEPKIVEATYLYKFYRLQEIISSALALSDQHVNSHCTTDKQKIFDEISRTLEEAWRLPEDRRRNIVKRLFLQWHPDKNPGNEEFCTEVFQHIKNEIERLERGGSRRLESYQGSYGAFYGFWGTRAGRYNSQRQGYRDSYFRHYGSCGHRTRSWHVPPSFCTTNPQPREARRWFRQAEADLAAADNDISTLKPSYVWACFKCHQAAEKALKAAQYSVDAYKTNVHNLVQNSLKLDDSQLTTLSSQLQSHLGDSTRMRYPDQVRFPQIPSDIYSREMAQDALELATMILDKVRSRVI
ncbi:hypothetical protein OS493_010859 [Desmophyllum pertusum]|uniref:HEPN domain-containing protein n=1 Tax=Desmophyllum pertusum TaxID=174260 RepID=A0A9W9ZEB3_9CNID|nr:hypothetical protein OS493_010859 [Desmophyllum pertusum]